MRNLLLASAIAFALPLAAVAQTGTAGSMSDPTTSSNPSSSIGPGTAKMITPGQTMSSPATAANLTATDKKFIRAAAVAGIAEVNDGQLAAQMGDATVKQIGNRMVADHGKANDKLAALSRQLGDPAPAQTDSAHEEISNALKAKSGAAFDTAYIEAERKGHEKTIALFKKEISNGGNVQLKDFAQATLPILEDHLAMIKSAQQS
jgi:putative membrane protein